MKQSTLDETPTPVEFADAVAHVLEWYWEEQRQDVTALIANGESDLADRHIFWSLLKLRCWLDERERTWQHSEGGQDDG